MEDVRHSDQDLREFRILIEKKLETARQELAYLVNIMDRGSFTEQFPEEKLKMIIDRQHEFILSLESKLSKIQEGTFGVTAKGQLVPKAKIIEVITASKAHEEEINFQSDAAVSALVQKLQEPASKPNNADVTQSTASPEAIQLPVNIHEMEFFKQLHAAANGVDLSITLKEKNGKFTISALPNVGDGGSIKPLLATGTPEELDGDFHNLITKPLHEATTLISNADEFKKDVEESVQEEKQEAKPKIAPKKSASAKIAPKKSAPKKSAPAKPVVEEPVKEQPAEEEKVPKQPELDL
jgi:PRTRC genetic system protein E